MDRLPRVLIVLCLACETGAQLADPGLGEGEDAGADDGWIPMDPAPSDPGVVEVSGPTLVRGPYLQRVGAREITVVWRTTGEAVSPVVRFGDSATELDTVVRGDTVQPPSQDGQPEEVNDHIVRIIGLDPATQYHYAIGADDDPPLVKPTTGTFSTAPALGSSAAFSVWVAGDTGTGDKQQADVLRGMELATRDTGPVDFALFLGDIAYKKGRDNELTEHHFSVYDALFRDTVGWPAFGNHEGSDGVSVSDDESGPYYEAFVLPRAGEVGGVASQTEAYYAFDYGNTHFIALDSDLSSIEPGSAQLEWLAKDLDATDATWVIAFFHHPPYTKGTHDSDDPMDSGGRMDRMREHALPVLEAGGVALVLTGHSHAYERSFLIDGGEILDRATGRAPPYGKLSGAPGTVYVVAGHGARAVDSTADVHPKMLIEHGEIGSGLLSISGDTLSWRAIDAAGKEVDRFAISREPRGWVAYNDLSAQNGDLNAANVTRWGYDARAGELRDIGSGATVATARGTVTMTGRTFADAPGVCEDDGADCWFPAPNGDNNVVAGSDADTLFGGRVDLHGLSELQDPKWVNEIRIDNLDPDLRYRVTLTTNRGNLDYADARYSEVTLSGARSCTATPSDGVDIENGGEVQILPTGFNGPGRVVQWDDVEPAADGSIAVQSRWASELGVDHPEYKKGYAMAALRLEQAP